MFQDLYPDDYWRGIPDDFWSFEAQPDGVRWTSYFFSHFLHRVGYTAGSVLADPVSFARQFNVPDEQLPLIVAFLERHGFATVAPDGSLTLTERGETWCGFHLEFGSHMEWSSSEAWWREEIASVHSTREYEMVVSKLNERHASMMRQFAMLLAAEAVRERSVGALRLGIVAAAVAIALANDGTRPRWVPSIGELRETLISLREVADRIGVDAGNEFMQIAGAFSGRPKELIMDIMEST